MCFKDSEIWKCNLQNATSNTDFEAADIISKNHPEQHLCTRGLMSCLLFIVPDLKSILSVMLNVQNCQNTVLVAFTAVVAPKRRIPPSPPSPTPPPPPSSSPPPPLPPQDQVSCQERQNSFSQNQTEIFPQMLRYPKHQQIL